MIYCTLQIQMLPFRKLRPTGDTKRVPGSQRIHISGDGSQEFLAGQLGLAVKSRVAGFYLL